MLGGYQLIDCTDITVTTGAGALTVNNAELANKFRSAKPCFVLNIKVTADGVTTTNTAVCVNTKDTGSVDEKVSMFEILNDSLLLVSTDGNNTTFTWAA